MFQVKIDKSNLVKVKSIWGKLDKTQKISVLSLLFLLLALPLGVLVALSPVKLFSRASLPVTPPISIPVTPTSSPRVTIKPTPTTTPKVTITPSPRVTFVPTPTVKATPRVTSAPTQTPEPVNITPRISTIILPRARVGRNYSTNVVGYDKDRSDNLTMIITNLPPGLSQGSCTQRVNLLRRKVIRCQIVGNPNRSGNYRVDVSLFDSRGGVAQRSYLLRVGGLGYIQIPPFFNFR